MFDEIVSALVFELNGEEVKIIYTGRLALLLLIPTINAISTQFFDGLT